MKRIILVALATILCLSLTTVASADVHVDVNVDVDVDVDCPSNPGCVIIDNVPGCIEPPDYCGPCEWNVKRAQKQIECKSKGYLDLLDRELQRTGWTRDYAKIIHSRTCRVIIGDENSGVSKKCKFTRPGAVPMTFRNESLGITKTAYMVVRTPNSSCNLCKRKFYVMFVNNFNLGDDASSYPRSWVIAGGKDYTAEEAVMEFVDWLVAQEASS